MFDVKSQDTTVTRIARRTRGQSHGPITQKTAKVGRRQAPEVIAKDGPARVLLGSCGTATSAIKTPSPMNCLAVRLKAGERWSYQPPAGHTVLWTAVGMGSYSVHTSAEALREAEARISAIETRLIQQGKL